ncbi:MAG: three-helix bundle dimerization domain-containing protein [Acidimicrobiia bacterium]
MNDAKNRQAVDRVVDALEVGVGRVVDHDRLLAAVEADFRRFDGARIRDFVPVLVENDIRARIMGSRDS